MHRPGRKFAIGAVAAAAGALMLAAAFGEWLGDERHPATRTLGLAGIAVVLSGLDLALRSGPHALGMRRLAAGGAEVLGAWRVAPDDWARCAWLSVADTGVSVPGLRGRHFEPSTDVPAAPVPVVCGRRGVAIGEHHFALSPGRGAGMEEVGLTMTRPTCLAFVIADRHGTSRGGVRVRRTLLLVPVPDDARDASHAVLRHHLERLASVRDLGDVARARPALARALYWGALATTLAAAVAGIGLEVADHPGTWPDALALAGILGTLGLLVLGWMLRAPR